MRPDSLEAVACISSTRGGEGVPKGKKAACRPSAHPPPREDQTPADEPLPKQGWEASVLCTSFWAGVQLFRKSGRRQGRPVNPRLCANNSPPPRVSSQPLVASLGGPPDPRAPAADLPGDLQLQPSPTSLRRGTDGPPGIALRYHLSRRRRESRNSPRGPTLVFKVLRTSRT